MQSIERDQPILNWPIPSAASGAESKTLWPHQVKALDDLTRHFRRSRKQAGFVVVPTGGGKTLIAARWLLSEHVATGGRVLWLTHRSQLLRQARATFKEFSYLLAGSEISTLNMGIVANGYLRWPEVGPDLQVVFSMLQSACAEDGWQHVKLMLKQSPKPRGLFVVVDEAHHACARTWIRLIQDLKDHGCPLLGLTATPMRMNEDDGRRLHKLFDRTVITQVKKQGLMEAGILARPSVETIKTQVSIEGDLAHERRALLNAFGDLSTYVLDKLVRCAPRNALIVHQYIKERAKYGKTIVFAINQLHAVALTKEFRDAGVFAEMVIDTAPNEQAIADYKNRRTPEVLVNVMMLTEGFDAPCTKTVFITRPTNSDVLVQQIVGRALRGPAAQGNEEAHLVTFVDTWSQFTPFDPDITMLEGGENPAEDIPRGKYTLVPISEEIILEAYALLRQRMVGEIVASYSHVPHGWYSWTNEGDEGPSQRHVLVFEHQQDAFDELRQHVEKHPKEFPRNRELSSAACHELVSRFFSDSPDPAPTWTDVRDLVVAWRDNRDVSQYTIEEKKTFDPRVIAQRLLKLSAPQLLSYLQKLMDKNPLCYRTYSGDVMRFKEEVDRAINDILKRASEPEEPLPRPKGLLAPWPPDQAGHDLRKLAQRVLNVTRHFPKSAPTVSDIAWSRKELNWCWGYYSVNAKNARRIIINRRLNSPDIEEAVLEFLLYHELLHADLPHAAHGGEFRDRERVFEPSQQAVREASKRQFMPGEGVSWKTLCDQRLDALNRYYRLEAGDDR